LRALHRALHHQQRLGILPLVQQQQRHHPPLLLQLLQLLLLHHVPQRVQALRFRPCNHCQLGSPQSPPQSCNPTLPTLPAHSPPQGQQFPPAAAAAAELPPHCCHCCRGRRALLPLLSGPLLPL
jgi:hypothetical protein